MKRIRIQTALAATEPMAEILVKGWVRTRRDAKDFSFLELNDGSCLANLQALVEGEIDGPSELKDITTGASVEVRGDLIPSPGKGQRWELKARWLRLLGPADPEAFPLQKKRHSDEYLRSIAHLRPRTNKFGAMLRIRSEASFAIHSFFRDRGFFYVHTPILSGSDCEGAGEMFRVTTLPLASVEGESGVNPFEQDFFGKEANLTVSGQLEAEALAQALGRVYTFGPTFRAENSNTPRHAAEFWMIEPEMAFEDLNDDMDLAEECVKSVVTRVLETCAPDVELFAKFVDPTLMPQLENILKEPFVGIPYAEAIKILRNAKRSFEFAPEYGQDLQTEHERYLTEEHAKKPVIVFDWPKSIKPFYMRVNADEQTVAAMDLLVPRIGELVGGSQREERLDRLEARMEAMGLSKESYWWYLDLRRFGTAPHSGFGMGFERLLMLLTGLTNIRDVIPFPRTPRHLEF
jgi:asparaginyl-tRNA synthetase